MIVLFFVVHFIDNVYNLYTVNIPVVNPYFGKIAGDSSHNTLPVVMVTIPVQQRYVYLQNGYVYIRNENGNSTRLTPSTGNRHPSINKRGTLVSFASPAGIYVIRPDGTSLIQIDSNATADYPEFSPDGLWILYVRNSDIYARRSDGSGTSVRLTYTGNVMGDIKFSPTGQEIVFTGFVNSRKHIFICPVQFSYGQPMTVTAGTPRDITPLTSDNYCPAFSPDGSSIVFVSTRNQIPELWLMNKDGTQQRSIIFRRVFRIQQAPVSQPVLRISFIMSQEFFNRSFTLIYHSSRLHPCQQEYLPIIFRWRLFQSVP